MDYLATQPQFSSLSLPDLLKARDQFHVHLMHKRNVVGTAIGRYLIRKDDPYPVRRDKDLVKIPAARGRKRPKKEPRTLENSEVRDYSWPCILVFVSRWEPETSFDTDKISFADFIPKTVYLEDGLSVPICVVCAPLVDTAPPPIDPRRLTFPKDFLSGGYPVVSESQGEERFGSIGCLVSDGHSVYALSNRHVTGERGETLYTYLNGRKTTIGKSSGKQLELLPFSKLYENWPGKNVFVNIDAGLIKIEKLADWEPSIFGLGEIGPMVDLSTYNLTLNLIGCPVEAFGAAGGSMFGKISALFYRYKSVGGFEYVSDFLIGGRTDDPLQTRPGDSGTIWVMQSDDVRLGLQPIAIQWGGTVFSDQTEQFPFVMATRLSSVCRELEVDLFRSRKLAVFDYWGALGHYTIGSYACDMLKPGNLAELMKANQELISFATPNLNKNLEKIKVPGFIQLADVPDKVWKYDYDPDKTPYGRKGPENPNHYADIDYGKDTVKGKGIPVDSLDNRTKTVNDLTTQNWKDYYDTLGWKKTSQRGCLPFRVWQIYKAMVEYVTNRQIAEFVAAAGVLAHYVGDGCQPLHASYLDDGDPWRNPDGTPAPKMLGHSKGYGAGVHHAYEASMINVNAKKIIDALDPLVGTPYGTKTVKSGAEAGFEVVELMRRSKKKIKPLSIVERYVEIKANSESHQMSKLLWDDFGTGTLAVMKDGCKTLAMLWQSAWEQGDGKNVDPDLIGEYKQEDLQPIYEDQNFVPSVALDDIDNYL